MASKQEHRHQKAAEKRRLKSKDRQSARRNRKVQEVRAQSATVDQAAAWSEVQGYLSETWADQGAMVHAWLTRKHSTGAVALARFKVDLAQRGVIEADVDTGLTENDVHVRLAELTEATGEGMLMVDGEMVVKACRTGVRHAEGQGYAPVPGYDHAAKLFGDLTPGPTHPDLLPGKPDEAPEKKGFFASLKERFAR